jgi:WD40 repeat protein
MKTSWQRLFISAATLIVLVGCSEAPTPQPANPPAPAANPAPANPSANNPNAPPAPEVMRPARELITSSPLDIDRKATFAEFSKRIAQAREDQKVLPDGSVELDRLYELVVSRGFQGATDAQEVYQQLDRWLSEDTADPTPQIALARATLNQAYAARGAEYGNVVSQRRLERFGLLLTDAHSRAREALAKGANDPEIHRLLLETGFELKAPPAQLTTWMEDAVRAGPKYYPLYDLIAKIVGVDAKGQYPMLARLAREAQTAHPGDDGLEIYARIGLAANRADRRALLVSGFDLNTLNAGAKVLLKLYPQAAELVDFMGVVAYISDDVELAREVLPELKSRKPNFADWGEEWGWQRFQQFAKFTPLRDQPERVLWPGPHGTNSMVFVDHGRHAVATARDGEANSIWVWSLAEQDAAKPNAAKLNTMPHHIQTEGRLGTHLDADRQGERLLTFDTLPQLLKVHLFDLTQGSVPGNLSSLRWYRPTLEPDAADPKLRRQRPEPNFFEISADGTVAVAFSAGQVELFDPVAGKKVTTFATPGLHPLENSARHLSPDGKWLALRGNETIEVWDCQQGKKHSVISDAVIKSDYLMAFAGLLPNQTALLASRKKSTGKSEVTLSTWDLQKEQLVPIGPIHHRDLPIATLGNDYVACFAPTIPPLVHVYRIRDGHRLKSIQAHFAPQISARFSPDGSWLATWEFQGPVKLWKIPIDAVP